MLEIVVQQETPSVVGLFVKRYCNGAIVVKGGHKAILQDATAMPIVGYNYTNSAKLLRFQALGSGGV
jgi:hypothetical protein